MSATVACALAHSVLPRARAQAPGVTLLGAWQLDGRDYAGTWHHDVGARGVQLPFRAHQVLADPVMPHSVVAVARRPGEFIARIDLEAMEVANLHGLDAQFVTNGHALFSRDARTLLVTENDSTTGAGAIGVYDANTLKHRARHPTRGIGPHALLHEPDGTLLVANGGVLTLAATGRAKLNAGSIDSSLVRLDAHGRFLEQWRLLDPELSIRHLARARSGAVGVALQAEHADLTKRDHAPVFALFDGRSLQVAEQPATPLKGYAGDITCIETPGGALFALGCAHAGVVAVWDAAGRARGCYELRGACALATTHAAIVAPSEHGEIGCLAPAAADEWQISVGGPAWDNHAAVFS